MAFLASKFKIVVWSCIYPITKRGRKNKAVVAQEIGKISAVALISFMEKKPSDLRKIKRVANRRNTGGVNDSCFAFFICFAVIFVVLLCSAGFL